MSVSKTLKLNKLDFSTVDSGCTILLIAKRFTGKSFLTLDIMSHYKSIPAGIVISRSEKVSPFYSNHIPDIFIYDEFNSMIIEDLLTRQRNLINKYGKDSWKTGGFDTRIFLIMDDCMSDASFFKDPGIKELFFNGRHYNILFILTTQEPMLIPTSFRTNLDFVFILREMRSNILGKIFEHYASVLGSYDLFTYCMGKFTEDYGCLVINNRSTKNNINEQAFWYRAQKQENLRLLSDRAWRFHQNRYCKDPSKVAKIEKLFFDKKTKTNILVERGE